MSYGTEFNELVGQVITEIRGLNEGSDSVEFVLQDGRIFDMYYEPDCCASCNINELFGDVTDLLGSPILFADERTSQDSDVNPYRIDNDEIAKHAIGLALESDREQVEYADSNTWTFYRIGTIKGTVVIRWWGSSNGYYSESVSHSWRNRE